MGRWRNVRDNFMRFQRKITKSGQAAETGRRYIYARQLDFLMGTRENIPTEASSQAEEEDAEADNEEPPAGNTDEIPGPSRTAQRRAAPTAPPRKRKIEDALLTFMQQRPAPTPAPDDDEDRAFFNSLLPMVRGFTPDQKIEFRLELLKMVKRYRSGLLPIQSQHEMQHFHFVTQPTPIRSHTQLQNSDHFPSSLFTSQRPSQTQTFTSVPQRSPLPPFSPDLASPSSQSQHSPSTYDYDLYSQQ